MPCLQHKSRPLSYYSFHSCLVLILIFVPVVHSRPHFSLACSHLRGLSLGAPESPLKATTSMLAAQWLLTLVTTPVTLKSECLSATVYFACSQFLSVGLFQIHLLWEGVQCKTHVANHFLELHAIMNFYQRDFQVLDSYIMYCYVFSTSNSFFSKTLMAVLTREAN